MADAPKPPKCAIQTRGLNLWYGDFQALFDVDFDVPAGRVTGLIGPSGCGKSTLLRSVNRIVERLGYVRTTGTIDVLGNDIFGANVELLQVRKQIGMVFQRPNPLPLSIRDNVLFGLRTHGSSTGTGADHKSKPTKAEEAQIVEQSLRTVLLWDKVKDRLGEPAIRLSLEEQQKLCIARLLPVKPRVLLMDEPCSALDPDGTAAVEELIWSLKGDYTILIVTHNMAQARRATEECAFMLHGRLVEHTETAKMFVSPKNQSTADYIEGRYG
ncbi:Phosphate transport ATP-binding protein PstB [Enhygromyxa salina]|uniref:Phosphate transport ATP-binding protein PstB n=1 Tax=Enhygromyxa salina TaxID=215803 RepID=A0A0C1ZLS3_9BACT|nr:phosphate ABC transporter ATP-binding protein [Enhygromyxa salina]KIG18479.1 Phosphate transport ATP-binding protein PstB [Enhygromyxa salina]